MIDETISHCFIDNYFDKKITVGVHPANLTDFVEVEIIETKLEDYDWHRLGIAILAQAEQDFEAIPAGAQDDTHPDVRYLTEWTRDLDEICLMAGRDTARVINGSRLKRNMLKLNGIASRDNRGNLIVSKWPGALPDPVAEKERLKKASWKWQTLRKKLAEGKKLAEAEEALEQDIRYVRFNEPSVPETQDGFGQRWQYIKKRLNNGQEWNTIKAGIDKKTTLVYMPQPPTPRKIYARKTPKKEKKETIKNTELP